MPASAGQITALIAAIVSRAEDGANDIAKIGFGDSNLANIPSPITIEGNDFDSVPESLGFPRGKAIAAGEALREFVSGVADWIVDDISSGKKHISTRLTVDNTSPGPTIEFNPFNTADNGGITITDSSAGIDFSPTDPIDKGRFIFPTAGSYLITIAAFLQQTSLGLVESFRIRKNGTDEVWTGDLFIHSSTDPEVNTIPVILPLLANDYLEFLVNSNLSANLFAHTGTSFVATKFA